MINKITDILYSIETDLSAIGLIKDKTYPHYFCTPVNAVIFASLGVDGIHFCIIPEETDITLEHSPVYVISPMLSQQHWVMIVAEDINTFFSLVVSTKDAGAMECISYLPAEKYADYLKEITADGSGVEQAVEALSDVFQLKKVSDVYGYVKALQKDMDLTRIKFNDDYYEVIN